MSKELHKQEIYPLWKALLYIILSLIMTFFLYLAILKSNRFLQKRHFSDPRYLITHLIQTGPEKEALKSTYLAELLHLSLDHPTHMLLFDEKEAKKNLLASPLIETANVWKKGFNTVYVDYTLRKPSALLSDFSNLAIDRHHFVFPLSPYFSPKKLPSIYLGRKEELFSFDTPLQGKDLDLAFDIQQLLEIQAKKYQFELQWIDVSSAFQQSLGKREIVVILENDLFPYVDDVWISKHILRLSPKTYAQELGNYMNLREPLLQQERQKVDFEKKEEIIKIIDMRIPKHAFIQEGVDAG